MQIGFTSNVVSALNLPTWKNPTIQTLGLLREVEQFHGIYKEGARIENKSFLIPPLLPLKFSVTHSCSKIQEIDEEYIMITLQWAFPPPRPEWWPILFSAWLICVYQVYCSLLINEYVFYNFSLSFCILCHYVQKEMFLFKYALK